MSSGAQVAVLGAGRRQRQAAGHAPGRGRPLLTLLCFTLLGVYGVLRWGTMLAPEPTWRLLGLVAVAVGVIGLGELAHTRAPGIRIVAIGAIAIGVIAIIPISGFPLHWVLELRIARMARAIGDGLAALPNVIVPYDGARRSTESVIVLGAGVLLLAAALELASSPRPHGQARLTGVALAMIVLAIVPSSLSAPRVVYLHGLLLFVLLAALVLSERVPAGRGWPAAGVVAIAAAVAIALAPGLQRRSPWVDVQTLAGTLGPSRGEAFDWSQTYGPLVWPHTGTVVLDVHTSRYPAYWKAVDLDEFDRRAWVSTPVGGDEEQAFQTTVMAANQARWRQSLTITLRNMSTSAVIAAGVAYPPSIAGLHPGDSFGTYASETPLHPGDAYQVAVYAPQPSPAALASAGTDYPTADLMPELGMLLSPSGAAGSLAAQGPAQPIQFASYGSPRSLEGYAGMTAAQALALLDGSPYGPVYALAQRLRRGTRTPYQYVQAVMRYLSLGYTYDLTPPVSALPIVSFLLDTKLGYCQQFAGAMALLLRMGGVPAHVSAGFTTGTYDPPVHAYEVSDLDAHAWVEAWFPGYGWVTFDPTAAAQSEAGEPANTPSSAPASHPQRPSSTLQQKQRAAGAATAGRRRRGQSPAVALALAGCLLALVAIFVLWRTRRRRAAPDADGRLAELERAFARCGRPLAGPVTLAALEQRFAAEPEAASYIRAIRLARFAREAPPSTGRQRRAVRRQLRLGLGIVGTVRALIALPPTSSARGTDAGPRATTRAGGDLH